MQHQEWFFKFAATDLHQRLAVLFTEELVSIYMILFILLLIAWLGGFAMFHAAGALIHILLIFAVISLILHFVMGRRTA